MAEPAAPSWSHSRARPLPTFDNSANPALCRSLWRRRLGQEEGERERAKGGGAPPGVACPIGDQPADGNSGTGNESNGASPVPSEADRLEQVYLLSVAGESGKAVLMRALAVEADALVENNLAAKYPNPSQLVAGFGLSAQGLAAVAGLTDALQAPRWQLRAAAADIPGDIGLAARPAVPRLLDRVSDESKWVRRNAVEALGVIAAPEAAPILARSMVDDRSDFVRHSTALSLAKIGKEADAARAALEKALSDENLYVRANARLALSRSA